MQGKFISCGLLLTLLIAFSLSASAQCNGRYKNVQFDSLNVTSDIQYGQSVNLEGNTVDLLMDVYEPAGDTLNERPLIIFAHGGSFTSGSKNNSAIEEIATKMAKRGFVTASINYRLTTTQNLTDSVKTIKEALMATQDGKAAVRYFRKNAAQNGNQFRVDTDQIFFGGNSAGAILGLHLGFADPSDTTRMNNEIQTLIDEVGGFAGNSGNPGYSSDVKAVINLSGALKNAVYVDANDPSLVSLHGPEDETVPYGRGQVFQNIPLQLITVEGSSLVHARADSLGLTSRLKTFYGAGHSPFVNDQAYMDTTIRVTAEFMQKRCDCYQQTSGLVAQHTSDAPSIDVYPNPAPEQVTIRLPENKKGQAAELQLLNNQGQIVRQVSIGKYEQKYRLERGDLPAGLYHIAVRQQDGSHLHGKVVLQ